MPVPLFFPWTISNPSEKEQFEFTSEAGTRTESRTLSIGLAGFESGMSAAALIKHADEAMYKAKLAGKNVVVRHGEE